MQMRQINIWLLPYFPASEALPLFFVLPKDCLGVLWLCYLHLLSILVSVPGFPFLDLTVSSRFSSSFTSFGTFFLHYLPQLLPTPLPSIRLFSDAYYELALETDMAIVIVEVITWKEDSIEQIIIVLFFSILFIMPWDSIIYIFVYRLPLILDYNKL